LGYAPDDIRRNYAAGTLPATPGVLNKTNVLPSVNLVYKLKNAEDKPMNLRLNYSQNVARPSIRELSNISMFDYELQASVTGNPNLKIVQISNYDLRWESYFKNNDNISVSFFYKDFRHHIELEYSNTYYWQNVDKSSVKGIELEGRKAICKGLEFRANISLVKSNTEFVRTRQEIVGGVPITYYLDTISRPMFGQAPYVFNGILSYSMDSIGMVLTLSYNLQGPRLVIASNVSSIADIYELDRHLVDFKATKKINKYFSASLTAKNILNAAVNRSYKTADGYKLYDTYQYGTSFQMSISYKL
jgi:outer membrane receptor protein involved in Fe transport